MPGGPRQREFEQRVRTFLQGIGATGMRTVSAGRHKRLYFTYQGTERFYTLGTTIRDRNAHYDAVRAIRHMVGLRRSRQ